MNTVARKTKSQRFNTYKAPPTNQMASAAINHPLEYANVAP